MKLKNQILTLGAMAVLGSSAFAATVVPAGSITVNTKWTAANSPYILEGIVFVKGCILDIEPGTIIRGQPRTSAGLFDPGALVIRPDAKIQARGTPALPIIFTSAAQSAGAGEFTDANADGIADRWVLANGDGNYHDATPASAPLPPRTPTLKKNANLWGGLVMMGDAFTNNGNEVDAVAPVGVGLEDDGFGQVEGLSAFGADAIYGGSNSEHNGGILKYVSLRHGGAELVTARELNGLTLYACGSQTTISYVDIYSTGDDGLEIFGGSVNCDHININYADDDGLDIDEGYTGTVQFVFILQGEGYGDNGMELDGEDKAENQASTPIFPVGNSKIYNATVLHNSDDNAAGAGVGARMRAGFTGLIANSIFRNYSAVLERTGIQMDTITGVETEPSARTQFNVGLSQVRNNTVFGFTTLYTGHGPGTGTITVSATGGVTGTFVAEAIPSVFYASTLNRTLDTGIVAPVHTALNGVNPRPSLLASNLAYGTPQDNAYIAAPAVTTVYKGAFDRTASSLWTLGWTALNKRGILTN